MKRTTKRTLGATAALVLGLAVAAAAHAEPGAAGGMAPMGGMGPGAAMGHGMMGAQFAGNPTDMIEGRLGALKAELKLTPDQEPAWQKFADAAQQHRVGAQDMHEGMHSGPQSAPERMARHTELMKQQPERMQKMSSALTDLYAVLTPEQKAIADHALGPMAGPHAAQFTHSR